MDTTVSGAPSNKHDSFLFTKLLLKSGFLFYAQNINIYDISLIQAKLYA